MVIHGATGGMGYIAVQLARWCGAHVIGTISSNENIEFARNIGVDEVIDIKATRFEDIVRDVDLVLDTACGRLISIATEPLKECAKSLGDESVYFVVCQTKSN